MKSIKATNTLKRYSYKQRLIKIRILFSLILISLTTFNSSIAQKKDRTTKQFRDCADCPEMIMIPAGEFTIGISARDSEHTATEGPERKVSIRHFAAGKFDVTLQQWRAFVKATNRSESFGCAFSGFKDTTRKSWESNPDASWQHLGFSQNGNHPVVCITWYDAQDYVEWLSKKTGGKYRLLTETEWEYAARAGTTTAYPWGDAPSHEYANYGADSGWTGLALGRDQWFATSPVGSFPPNAFGLYDMHGNVLQYVEDYFSESYAHVPVDGSAYKGEDKLNISGRLSFMNGTRPSDYRMVRGGDWGDPPAMIRSGFRNWAPGRGFTLQNYRSGGVGFRVAKEL